MKIIKLLPGIVLPIIVALLACWLESLLPIHLIGSAVIAMFIGMFLNQFVRKTDVFATGLKFTSKKILKFAIILLGLSLNITAILHVGQMSLTVMVFTLLTCFGGGYFISKALGLNWKLSNLISAGTGICGGSAIAAIAPTIDADDNDVAYAMSATFLFDMAMIVLFPIMGRALGMTDQAFGIWAGTAVNDTSSVVATGYAFSEAAGDFATMVKLTRTLAIISTVPVLTMRVLSEEQKNKTDQLLLTAPVKISDIILGKYLALLTIYVIPVLIMCLYPLLLGTHGTVSYAVSYTSILGYFLLGAAYISVGVFVSSITESQVIAAVVSFVILFLCYVESGIANFFPEGAGSSFFAFFIIIALVCLWIGSMIKNPIITGVIAVIGEGALTAVYFTKSTLLEGKIQDLLGVFNMAGHMDNFVNGILDISGVVYYLSVIAICTFLAMQSLQKKRWN